ncbi:fimbrial biogenesis chaperone [Trinickia mobilis]|uniref:fimbrial biogenesis chaperone n=1 Tax=Trinickia mobilis TaxID=2816356 RepID=UPI001A90AF20|nr:molecular chaperone [Trinickia mobilis]
MLTSLLPRRARLRPAICALTAVAAVATAADANAGAVLGGTRVVFPGDAREASLSVKNTGDAPFLIQSWVDNQPSGKPAFFVTPPLARLDAGKETLLRILPAGVDLPKDRESVTRLNVKEIPAKPNTDENVLQFAVRSQIKLFYRPAGLKGSADQAPAQLVWSIVPAQGGGNALRVDNPTPYHVTFARLTVEGAQPAEIKDADMVPPLDHVSLPLNVRASGTPLTVSYTTVNDYGGISEPVSKPAAGAPAVQVRMGSADTNGAPAITPRR